MMMVDDDDDGRTGPGRGLNGLVSAHLRFLLDEDGTSSV